MRRWRSVGFASMLTLAVMSPITGVYASESNEVFVRQSLESFFIEAVERLPENRIGQVVLDFDRPHSDNLNVSGTLLHSVLRTKGVKLLSSTESSTDVGLGFKLDRVEFAYENRNGSLFARGDLYRVLRVSGNFGLSKNENHVWEDYLAREYSEEIELEERDMLESDFSTLFHAELPPGPVQKLWEPVIVTSIIGGLVYLFFASR